MNHKKEIGENPNKIMKPKPTSLTVVFFMLLCAVFVSCARAQAGWRVVPTPPEISEENKRTGETTVFEEHTNGSKRITRVTFFPGTNTTWKERIVTTNNNSTTIVSKNWNDQGEAIAYTEETIQGTISYSESKEDINWQGRQIKGARWYFPLGENSSIVGAKIEEDYNPQTKKWVKRLGKISPAVNIFHHPSRRNDAKNAESILNRNGYKVVLHETPVVNENVDGQSIISRIVYYYPSEIEADSRKIANLLKFPTLNVFMEAEKSRNEDFDQPFVTLYLLDESFKVKEMNFSLTVETTPNTPNEDEEIQKRLQSWVESLDKLAPGTGVAHIVSRNARNELGVGIKRLEFRDAVSGKEVMPLREPLYSSHENYVLPQGTYRVTPVVWSTHDSTLQPVEIQVRAGAITKAVIGGNSVLGRVKYESQTVTGEKSGGYIFVYAKGENEKWFNAADGSEPYLDLPSGRYRVDVKQDNAMRLWTEYFTVEAGKTVTLRPINRGRIAVRKGDAPADFLAAVSTLSSEHVGYLKFEDNEFVDVPAGEYQVFIRDSKQKIVVEAGRTILLKP